MRSKLEDKNISKKFSAETEIHKIDSSSTAERTLKPTQRPRTPPMPEKKENQVCRGSLMKLTTKQGDIFGRGVGSVTKKRLFSLRKLQCN
jgi:hypothetical protein